ncbi:unnamed protein product [Gordionus sp. m RMFG-2023]
MSLVEKFENFITKVFICQINDLHCDENSKYYIYTNNVKLYITLVWVQGFIIKILDENSILISDGTGYIDVFGYNKVPNGCLDHKIGMYIAVLGGIQDSINNHKANNSLQCSKAIKATKISDFSSENINIESFWSFEVITSQDIITKNNFINTK